jgi:dCMP deaminase
MTLLKKSEMEKSKEKIVITLVPAIHTGYLKFFKKYKGARLFLIGKSFFNEFPKLERDVRWAKNEDVLTMLNSLKIFKKVEFLEKKDVLKISKKAQIIMPEDDVLREFSNKYLKDFNITFKNIFLRWDWSNATHIKSKPSSFGTITKKQFAKDVLQKLELEAQKSSDWWRQISSALVKDGKIIHTAYNHHLPSDYNLDLYGDPRSNFQAGEHIDKSTSIHSEAGMVAWAAGEGVAMKGLDLYVHTFPCQNCAMLVAKAGIKNLYFKEGYSNLNSEEILKAYKVKVWRVVD